MGAHAVHLRTALILGGVALGAGCPTVDLGDTPADIGSCRPDRGYFESTIWPMYIDNPDAAKSCVSMGGCHDTSNNGRSGMQFLTEEPIDFDANYRTVARHLNCADPESSDVVTYPTGLRSHPVTLFSVSDPEVTNVFLPWFDQ
jgi:hypothetical protein